MENYSCAKSMLMILCSTNPHFSEKFGKLMSEKFEISMMSELKFFLGLQIKQTKEGTFVSQTKYTKDLFKKLNMQESKGMKTPMHTSDTLFVYVFTHVLCFCLIQF